MADQPDPIQQKIDEAAAIAAPPPPATPLPPEPPPHPVKPKPNIGKIAAVLAVLFLLVSLPVAIYFVSQKQKPVADTRSKAATNTCCRTIYYEPETYACHDKDVCNSPCEKGTPNCCWGAKFDCSRQECKSCSTTTSTPAPPAPTPTPTPAPQCQRIKVYKGGAVVTDLTTLRTGDQLELAVVGANATKAHIRVNGAAYVETTTKNAAGEYTIAYTIPPGTYSFTLEAEVFQNGTWQ